MRMEDLLDLYAEPYNPQQPVLCFDERPCQVIGDTVMPLPMPPGQSRREDAQYARHGVCCLLLAVEPLAGRRFAQIRSHRTKIEYAEFMQALVAQYPQAERLRLVQDNLNTHTAGSFYHAFDPTTARQLTQRFEFHATPKHASWLNMAEIELSAIARQCLEQRLPTQEALAHEVFACVNERNEHATTITWRFTTNDARKKLKRHYDAIKN